MTYVKVLEDNKVNPNAFLSDEQKEIVEDQKFIEKKKKEYGRY